MQIFWQKNVRKNAASTNLGRFPVPASTILARFSPPASTNLGRFPTPCIDQSWAIYHNKKDPPMRVFSLVPRAGVEPARIAPLVFETSASTDSAIWATQK